MPGGRRQWLVDARKKMKMTQSNVASQAGISRNYLSQIENGTGVRVNVAKKLSDFYGVSIDYLTCRTDDPTPLSSVQAVAHMENKEDLNYDALEEILYKTLKRLREMEKKE